MNVGGIIGFFIVALFLGTKVADKAYDLEPTEFGVSQVKKDGFVYNHLNRWFGNKFFSLILVSNIKDYIRRLENISKIVYILGLMILVQFFLSDGFSGLLMHIVFLGLLSQFIAAETTFRGFIPSPPITRGLETVPDARASADNDQNDGKSGTGRHRQPML